MGEGQGEIVGGLRCEGNQVLCLGRELGWNVDF